ncbi:MAG: hypothetical protein RR855_06490 [Comamonas sp.]
MRTWTSHCMAVGAAALMATSAWALTPAEYKTGHEQINAEYKAAIALCKPQQGNAKDVCEKEAKGREKVAGAELNYRSDGSEGNRYKLAKAKADADYDVAKEKCDDLKGDAKDQCQKTAKATHQQALSAAQPAK